MGDMNEYPDTKDLVRNLRLHDPRDYEAGRGDTSLYNLMLPLNRELKKNRIPHGSHKWHGEWTFLDQVFVNGSMLDSTSSVRISDVRPFALPFMLTDDKTYLGHRPRRSYYGFQYEAGFSDHLPVVFDIVVAY